MYTLMMILFILSIVYYFIGLLEFMVLTMQAIADNPFRRTVYFSWGHIVLIVINVLVTIVTAMYLFGGCR